MRTCGAKQKISESVIRELAISVSSVLLVFSVLVPYAKNGRNDASIHMSV